MQKKWLHNHRAATDLWIKEGLPLLKKHFPNGELSATDFVINVLEGE